MGDYCNEHLVSLRQLSGWLVTGDKRHASLTSPVAKCFSQAVTFNSLYVPARVEVTGAAVELSCSAFTEFYLISKVLTLSRPVIGLTRHAYEEVNEKMKRFRQSIPLTGQPRKAT